MIKALVFLFIAAILLHSQTNGTFSGTFTCASGCPAGAPGPPGPPGPPGSGTGGFGVVLGTFATVSATPCNSGNSGQAAQTTDSIYTAVCDGTAWEWFWRGTPVTPPPQTGWTLDAVAGSSITPNADGTVTFFFGLRNAQQMDTAYLPGATNQTITALMCSDMGNVVSGSSDTGAVTSDGLGFRDSTGKYSIFFSTVGNVAAPFYLTVDRWNSVTSYNTVPDGYPHTYTPPSASFPAWESAAKLVLQDCHWRRIQETSTTSSYSFNTTGSSSNWTQFYGEPVNAFLGSGTHSPAIVAYTYGNGNRITLVSWAATSP